MSATACPGCGLVRPSTDGPTHPYIGSSPACWALFGEVLAREFNDPTYFRLHQVTVDTYAVQHPGVPERRSIQSVGLHLMTLCLMLEDGVDPREGPQLHKRMVTKPHFQWLTPPEPNGDITVETVLAAQSATQHEELVETWARAVWNAWSPHHGTVRAWLDESLG
ncbi:MAG: DUF5946 family protein [Actinomycetota bacterium]